jgi:hypothetical protein
MGRLSDIAVFYGNICKKVHHQLISDHSKMYSYMIVMVTVEYWQANCGKAC